MSRDVSYVGRVVAHMLFLRDMLWHQLRFDLIG
jgi:hypothetical protein